MFPRNATKDWFIVGSLILRACTEHRSLRSVSRAGFFWQDPHCPWGNLAVRFRGRNWTERLPIKFGWLVQLELRVRLLPSRPYSLITERSLRLAWMAD